MMSATSASHSSESSYAFLSSPFRRLANVTCRLILFSIRFSSTLPRPIFLFARRAHGGGRPARPGGGDGAWLGLPRLASLVDA
ncbi:hypothetical protein SETIT_9G490300v2 [Setaria italica]|uniref:Uncharacterized protein n=1 Tax=Setaria italica TaxID=4555 RepID=A0A368SU37_SETIT|nr:hypothetical protein SETIT_9G490300v2 [Setaria italica]